MHSTKRTTSLAVGRPATGAWNALSPEAATGSLTKIAAIPGPDTITVGIRIGEKGHRDYVRVESGVPGVLLYVTPQQTH